jgi:chitodextrinase
VAALFAALPALAQAADPVIYAGGDIACDPASADFNGGAGTADKCRERYTSNDIINGAATKVLALGDLQYNSGSLSNFNASYNKSWGRIKSITRPAIGNHEGGGSGYYDYFNGSGVSDGPAGQRGKGYYSFNVGAWHVIALNSNCSSVPCSSGSAQDVWLRNDLAANKTACTLAFWHHPRFSSGFDGDNTFMQALFQDLYNADADLVLVGHSHDYERFAPQNPNSALDRTRGIREFVVGTGGAFFTGFSTTKPNSEVRQNKTYGTLKLTLHSTSYDWRFIGESGKTWTDSGTDACHGGGSTSPGPDTQAPTAPTNLTASAPSPNEVDLNWAASSDNVGVAGYDVWRSGSLLAQTTGTSFTDTAVTAGGTYTYQVGARDAAGNVSGGSNMVTITTPSTGSSTLAFPAQADARVYEAAPTTNYGTSYLRTDGGADPDVDSYLTFNVSGLTGAVQSARLRVYAYTGSVDGPAVFSTTGTWLESGVGGITWATKPPPTGGPNDDKGSVPTNSWVEYDVKPFIGGDGTYSFRLATTSSDGVDIYSRESASLRPELVITQG